MTVDRWDLIVSPIKTNIWIEFEILRHQRNALSKDICHSWTCLSERTENQKNDINVMRFTINATLPLWVCKRPMRKKAQGALMREHGLMFDFQFKMVLL